MNIQERLTAFAMLGAGWVMWLLVILSIIGLAIVLERAYYLITSRDDPGALRRDLTRFLREDDLEGARQRFGKSPALEAKVIRAGLAGADRGPNAADERMSGELATGKLQMERNLAFLGTVANNAPFLGLLGTVIGVIRAFHALDAGGGDITSGLMAEIGEALVATAIGILVALPSVMFFNIYQRIIKTRVTRADTMRGELVAYLHRADPAPTAEAAE